MPLSFTVAELARALAVDDDGDRWREALALDRDGAWSRMVDELFAASLGSDDVAQRKECSIFTVSSKFCYVCCLDHLIDLEP